ncbi:hypothetical protein [Plantibacter sp. RU18]|uniref:hypothetical protein n=1 Tax=Plantibacter sp. RU18 TaxID=3158143 RepID=UPI003D361975
MARDFFCLNRIKQAFVLLVLVQIGAWRTAYQALSAASQNPILSIVIVFAAGMVIVDLFGIATYVREASPVHAIWLLGTS